jgi:acetyl esterase/lipase
MRYRAFLSTFLTCGLASASSVPEIFLWPNGAPGFEAVKPQQPERLLESTVLAGRVSLVDTPSITVFLPPKDKATGVGIVVAPGGGHSVLVIDKEGYDIAAFLNSHGIAAFVLQYRLARTPGSRYTLEGDAVGDALRAVRVVRSRAQEFGIDPAKIGFMGFSAGGELAALAETRFDLGNQSAADPIDRVSSRADFAVVVYPGYKPGSITVPKNAPPTFLVCADNDPSHVVATVNLYLGLQKEGVSSEMHIYASGGHGFGMKDQHAPVTTWNTRLLEWMVDRKIVASY